MKLRTYSIRCKHLGTTSLRRCKQDYLFTRSSLVGIKLINFYQKHVSIFLRPSCVFYPSCSEYTKQAIEKYGTVKGFYLGFLRILRCHPWQKNHIDPLL